MPSEIDVRTFISSSFRSVWALDLVQLLHGAPKKGFTRAELIDDLRASDSVVQQCVDALMAVGLIMTDDGGLIKLRVGDKRTAELLAASIDLYRKRPDKVRRLIVVQSLPGVTAFSDAFRLRKD